MRRSFPARSNTSGSKGRSAAPTSRGGEKAVWSARIILRILANDVYAGTLVQGKTRKPDFRSKAVVQVDESEWDVCRDAHEPIVDVETFELVQNLAARDMRNAPGSRTALPLSGYLFCADCGATMARHSSPRAGGGRHYYYSCESHRKDKGSCTRHKIGEDELFRAVMDAVARCVRAGVDGDAALEGSNPFRHDRKGELARRGREVDGRIERSRNLRVRMYSDYSEGVISKEQYMELAKGNDRRIRDLESERARIDQELAFLSSGKVQTWEEALARHRDDREIDRVMVVELLDRVLVGKGGEVTVDFRCGDPLSAPIAKEAM